MAFPEKINCHWNLFFSLTNFYFCCLSSPRTVKRNQLVKNVDFYKTRVSPK